MFKKAAIVLYFSLCAPVVFASEWSIENLNKTIDQTNFVVNRGCSGTLISLEERLILTNYHCIDRNVSIVEIEEPAGNGTVRKIRRKKYTDVTVEQHGYYGHDKVSTSSYVAEIVAEEKKKDLAIVRIKSNIPHQMASKLLLDGKIIRRGEKVYIVGNPAGNDATVVDGIISNLNRTFEFPWTGNEKLAMIQFSGGTYGGNSGGALYNSEGYLIGVPAAGHSAATFIGLAIPISVVKTFMRDHCLANVFDAIFNKENCLAAKKKVNKDEKD